MEKSQTDRIYVFLSSGIGHNKNPGKKYYYDRSDKTFFNLKIENYAVKLWEKEEGKLSASAKNELQLKIQKVKTKNPDIIEIKHSSRNFDLFPVPKNEESEEFKQRAEIWRALFDEVDTFLNLNNISIEQARLIE